MKDAIPVYLREGSFEGSSSSITEDNEFNTEIAKKWESENENHRIGNYVRSSWFRVESGYSCH